MRDAERRAQSGHGRRYEAALFGAVTFEGREKEISEQETYEAALREIEKLFHARLGTAEGARLENLVCLVESYEEVAFPISDSLTPHKEI